MSERIAARFTANLKEDWEEHGFGWLFTERYFYRAIALALSERAWTLPSGFTTRSQRVAAEFPIPQPIKGRRSGGGRPPNVDLAVVHSNHARRHAVRATKAAAEVQWQAAVEVKWASNVTAPTRKAINGDLSRLVRLRSGAFYKGTNGVEYAAFVLAGQRASVRGAAASSGSLGMMVGENRQFRHAPFKQSWKSILDAEKEYGPFLIRVYRIERGGNGTGGS
jgi:hypothetical protein